MEYKTSEGETRSNLKEPASVFDHSSNIRPNTFGVFNLAGMFWRGKWTVLTLAFIGFAIALIIAASVNFRNYTKHYEYIVQLTFSGVENNVYPNGTAFSISDITAPAVLNAVYENNKISEYGILRHEFADLISITPYAPNRQFILSSYDSVFSKRKATLAELEEAQKNMNQKLKADARRAVILRLKVFEDKLSHAQVSSILADVVTKWASNAIDEKGAVEFNIQSVRPSDLAEEKFAGLVGIDLLSAVVVRFNSIQKYVTELEQLPGANRAKDPETGNNINYLSDKMMDIWRSIENYPANWSLEAAQLENTGKNSGGLNLYKSFSGTKVYTSQLQYLDLINNKRRLVAFNAELLEKIPFGAAVVDSANGTTALDVSQTIRELNQFDLENLRTQIVGNSTGDNCQANIDYLKIKLNRLKREFRLVNRNVEISTDAQNIYVSKAQNTLNLTNLSNTNKSVESELISPQLSGGFIDKLIALSENSGDKEFREKLINDTIRYRKNAAMLSARIEKTNAELAILQDKVSLCENTALTTNRKENEIELNDLNARMNEFGKITNKIAARLQLASAIVKILKTGNTLPTIQLRQSTYFHLPKNKQKSPRHLKLAIICVGKISKLSHFQCWLET